METSIEQMIYSNRLAQADKLCERYFIVEYKDGSGQEIVDSKTLLYLVHRVNVLQEIKL